MFRVFLVCVFLGVFSGNETLAQTSKPSAPNTTDTKAQFFNQLTGQPDFMGDMTVTVEGSTVKQTFIKKAGKVRCEFHPFEGASDANEVMRGYKVIVISIPGKPVLVIDPQRNRYTEFEDQEPFPIMDSAKLIEGFVNLKNEANIVPLGEATVNGYATQKVKMVIAGEKAGVFFYFAKDHQNLLIKMELENQQSALGFELANISLEVADGLFEPPRYAKHEPSEEFLSGMKENFAK
ncbi:MAG: hypothetical protein HY774_28120 [Acidobacteria bacterium]|nr:hypothetical protein [Acidobacteriota bacterium]